ncbi:MAG: nucleotidyltransferase domain-containing protein [Calditrichota bacterium]
MKTIKSILPPIIAKLQRDYQPERIILFGSYAYGKPTKDSDIDLFIVKDTPLRWVDRFVEVKRIIFDPNRHIAVSPCVYTPSELEERLQAGDSFVNEILRKGQVVYERPQD